MPTAKDWNLPKPADWQCFQRLCVDLLQARLKPRSPIQDFGRSGQGQDGVDILVEESDGLSAYQCKRTDRLTIKVVREESAKINGFPLPLVRYTFLTTADPDASLQVEVVSLSLGRQGEGKCPVSVVYWQTIQQWIAEYPHLFRSHFPAIYATWGDLLGGAARRLEAEFPGTHLEVKATAQETHTTIHPGPGGIRFDVDLTGPDVRERFERAMQAGDAVTFTGAEVRMKLPDALAEALDDGNGEISSFSVTPFFNESSFLARLLVHGEAAHRDVATFKRRGQRTSGGIAVTVRVEKAGSKRLVIKVVPDVLPVGIRMEQNSMADSQPPKFTISIARSYRSPVSAQVAYELEQMLMQMEKGCYFGLFAPGRSSTCYRFKMAGIGDAVRHDLFGLLAALAQAADWDVMIPEQISDKDCQLAERLLPLFREGRHVVHGVRGYNLTLREVEGLQSLRELVNEGVEPWSLTIDQGPGDIEFLDSKYWMPRVKTTIERMTLDDDERARLNSGAPLPMTIHWTIPEGARYIEEILPDEPEPEAS